MDYVDDYLLTIFNVLLQLFLKAHVNTSELTDIIIQQNHIGSVIRVRAVGLNVVTEPIILFIPNMFMTALNSFFALASRGA